MSYCRFFRRLPTRFIIAIISFGTASLFAEHNVTTNRDTAEEVFTRGGIVLFEKSETIKKELVALENAMKAPAVRRLSVSTAIDAPNYSQFKITGVNLKDSVIEGFIVCSTEKGCESVMEGLQKIPFFKHAVYLDSLESDKAMSKPPVAFVVRKIKVTLKDLTMKDKNELTELENAYMGPMLVRLRENGFSPTTPVSALPLAGGLLAGHDYKSVMKTVEKLRAMPEIKLVTFDVGVGRIEDLPADK
jgi:hypothetical protein